MSYIADDRVQHPYQINNPAKITLYIIEGTMNCFP